jgi:hypothetical protein
MYNMFISENYKNVHSGHDHDISWEQSHKIHTHIATQSQPSNAFQPASTEHHFKAQTLGNYMTEVYNQK